MIPWKDLREIFRGVSSIVLSTFITVPLSKLDRRIQLDGDLFMKILQDPPNPKGTILMIRGGAIHMGKEGHYIKWSCAFLSEYRVYFLEKFKPMINFEFSDDVSVCLKWLRRNHPEPLIVLGFSMGGILTWTYLGKGYDDADLYVPVSSPINIADFQENINKHIVYRNIHGNTLKGFGAKDDDELLIKAGYSLKDRDEVVKVFIDQLKSSQNIWHDKCIPVSGSHDTLLEKYRDDLNQFDKCPNAVIVENGTHCCLDTVWYACMVIKVFTETKFPRSQ